jgi:predicted phosphodiesterase
MKLAVCSDVHLEFGDLDLQNTDNADVLVLSGDIMVAKDLIMLEDTSEAAWLIPTTQHDRAHRYFDFIKRCSERFNHVVMVAGNHEHYHGDFNETMKLLKKYFAEFTNVYVLDKETKVIDDVTFIGGTLWTDLNKEDPITLHAVKSMMNDFNCIRNTAVGPGCRFLPIDSVEDHHKMMQYLKFVLENNTDKPVVVVGHHSPSKLSTHPRYMNETLMNGAYSSDLSEFIMDHPQIKLWTHGHTHEPFDYMVGDTRIVCNPRGYHNHEERADEFELMFVEV